MLREKGTVFLYCPYSYWYSVAHSSHLTTPLLLFVFQLSVQLLGESRLREFVVPRQDSVEIVGLITAQIKNVFPITALE